MLYAIYYVLYTVYDMLYTRYYTIHYIIYSTCYILYTIYVYNIYYYILCITTVSAGVYFRGSLSGGPIFPYGTDPVVLQFREMTRTGVV